MGSDAAHYAARRAPLGESDGTVSLEDVATGEAAFLVEVVRNGGVNRSKFLQTSHAPETKHRHLLPSEWQVRILRVRTH